MITSVTSATVAATSAVVGWGVALGAGGALLVVGLLFALELIDASRSHRRPVLHRVVRSITVPLLIVFFVSVAARSATILSGAA